MWTESWGGSEKRESRTSPCKRQHPLHSELSCGRNVAPARGRMALGGFLGMRTWALAGQEEGVKQGARQEGSCWVCFSITRTGQGLGEGGRWGPGRGRVREDPGSRTRVGVQSKSVDSAASLPGLELIPSLPICVTLGKSLPCPMPLSDQLNTGILIALTI